MANPLPFLKKQQKVAGVIVEERQPDQPKEDGNPGLLSAAEDLLAAIESKSARAVASALQAAVDLAMNAPPEHLPDQEG